MVRGIETVSSTSHPVRRCSSIVKLAWEGVPFPNLAWLRKRRTPYITYNRTTTSHHQPRSQINLARILCMEKSVRRQSFLVIDQRSANLRGTVPTNSEFHQVPYVLYSTYAHHLNATCLDVSRSSNSWTKRSFKFADFTGTTG
jgi:hypothetical protein